MDRCFGKLKEVETMVGVNSLEDFKDERCFGKLEEVETMVGVNSLEDFKEVLGMLWGRGLSVSDLFGCLLIIEVVLLLVFLFFGLSYS